MDIFSNLIPKSDAYTKKDNECDNKLKLLHIS